MKRETVKDWEVPSLAMEDVIRARFGDPAKFLQAFLRMRALPTWNEVAFDHEALEWISRVWDEAAKASVANTRLRDACIRERDRYKRLETDLKNGEHERGDSGIVFLNEASDWPHPKVLRGAIDALTHAGITEAMQ